MVPLPGMPHPRDPDADSLPVEPDKGPLPPELPPLPEEESAGHPAHPHPISH
jgi:hypothetical protein